MKLELLCYEENNLPKDWEPYFIYLIFENEVEIGRITLRSGYSDLTYYTGHIGYEIYNDFRKQGYGTMAVELIIKEAIRLGYNKLWFTCNEDNIASKKIINKVATFIELVDVPKKYLKHFDNNQSKKEIYEWKGSN